MNKIADLSWLALAKLQSWYEREFGDLPFSPEDDPVLAMTGVGLALWANEDGDAHVRRMRDESMGSSARRWTSCETG